MIEQQKRIELFDVIKGIMILFVIIAHYKWQYPDDYLKYGFGFYLYPSVPVFLVITGYFTAVGLEKRGADNYFDSISFKMVFPKLIRFLIPYSIAFIIEIPILIYGGSGVLNIIFCFVTGGIGHGSYYTPIMIQVIFIGPLLYFIVKKYDLKGVIFCFLLNGLWEWLLYSIGISGLIYKLLAFRFISLLAFGIFIAIGKEKISNIVLIAMLILGIAWQYCLNYMPIVPPYMNYAWAKINYISSIPVMVILYIVIKNNWLQQIRIPFVSTFGKASYNIYLVQMVVYGCGLSSIIYRVVSNELLQLLSLVGICCLAGVLFYIVEQKITKSVIKLFNENHILSG